MIIVLSNLIEGLCFVLFKCKLKEHFIMKELELCHPKSLTTWRLFNKKNHRCNNRFATYDELRKALDAWKPDGSPTLCAETYFYNINPTSKLWLRRCLLEKESIDDCIIVCLYCEDYSFDERWFKVILYDKKNQRFLLRTLLSITNPWLNGQSPSQDKSFKIDLSTMGTDETFWIYVKKLLVGMEPTVINTIHNPNADVNYDLLIDYLNRVHDKVSVD